MPETVRCLAYQLVLTLQQLGQSDAAAYQFAVCIQIEDGDAEKAASELLRRAREGGENRS